MSEQPQDAMDAFQEPTSWPKVIGIISMIWGGIGLTCVGCGGVMTMAGTAMLPPEMQNGPLPPTMGFGIVNMLNLGTGTLFSILLFAAGLTTLRRSMTGRTLHLVWSAASLAWIPVALYLAYYQTEAMKVFVRDNPDSPFSKGGSPEMGLMIGIVMTAIFSIYPVFIFIWFLFIKKTKESFGAAAVKDYI